LHPGASAQGTAVCSSRSNASPFLYSYVRRAKTATQGTLRTARELVASAENSGIRLAYLNGKLWVRPSFDEVIPFRRSEFRTMLLARQGISVTAKENSRIVNEAIDILIENAALSIQRPTVPDFALFFLETDADGHAILGYLNQAGGFHGRLGVLYDRRRIVTREFCGRLAGTFTATFLHLQSQVQVLHELSPTARAPSRRQSETDRRLHCLARLGR
jgi:hypothetical protein